MLKIIACDDDERDLKQIAVLVKRYMEKRGVQEYETELIASANGLLQKIREGARYNIYILAIMMEEQDGIRLGKSIREFTPDSPIIYVTSSPEYALGAFGVYASGYLLKPTEQSVFDECMDRVLPAVAASKTESTYALKSKDGIISIELKQLMRVENVARVMHFYMKDGEHYESVYIRQPFEKQLEQILLDGRFVQSHKSFIINMEYVDRMTSHDFVMSDGTSIPISRNNLAAAKRSYLEYLANSQWF